MITRLRFSPFASFLRTRTKSQDFEDKERDVVEHDTIIKAKASHIRIHTHRHTSFIHFLHVHKCDGFET